MGIYCWLLLVQVLVLTDGRYTDISDRNEGEFGPGTPLYLSSYIDSGNIDRGRESARVPFTEKLNITSYAGLFTVNKYYDSHQFFWYFPPLNKDKSAPIIVWLEGGPGCSSLFGLFEINGPLAYVNESIVQRDVHWALYYHMIYIDNPIGSGFSHTKDFRGYSRNEVQVGDNLHSTLTQFFKIFPELQANELFIAGESYGGKFVPALAYTIHQKNPTADVPMNLKGLMIGNGFTDPINQLGFSKYLYQLGLVDEEEANLINILEEKMKEYIKKAEFQKASYVYDNVFLPKLTDITGYKYYFNYLQPNFIYPLGFVKKMEDISIRKDLHVGNLTFNAVDDVSYKYLYNDLMQSIAPWMSVLLDNYPVLVYSGQLDLIVPYTTTVNYLRKLKFEGSEDYQCAPRVKVYVKGQLAGYRKIVGNLNEVLIRNAGHSVPYDQPLWALAMVTNFIDYSQTETEANEGIFIPEEN